MPAGILDHTLGTRNAESLGGIRRVLPWPSAGRRWLRAFSFSGG